MWDRDTTSHCLVCMVIARWHFASFSKCHSRQFVRSRQLGFHSCSLLFTSRFNNDAFCHSVLPCSLILLRGACSIYNPTPTRQGASQEPTLQRETMKKNNGEPLFWAKRKTPIHLWKTKKQHFLHTWFPSHFPSPHISTKTHFVTLQPNNRSLSLSAPSRWFTHVQRRILLGDIARHFPNGHVLRWNERPWRSEEKRRCARGKVLQVPQKGALLTSFVTLPFHPLSSYLLRAFQSSCWWWGFQPIQFVVFLEN